jgi:hypothetical protein
MKMFESTRSKVNLDTQIAAAKSRLDELKNIRRKVGIVRMWPEQAVAEHENIERFRTAFEFIGVELVEIDRYGIIIGSPNQQITSDDVDFVLHLHFETSKTYNVTSVAALWNPTQFYYDWGFERFWANQMTHDIYAYTGSEEIVGLVRASRGKVDPGIMPVLNHTLADPVFEPTPKSNYRVFYCGINWERISGKKGRHDEVLKSLDGLGSIDIYGPRTLQGKPVWDGFKGYCEPLPFDGRTVIEKIADSGTCLVFSSEAHIQSDIMSNRLFEALAAGAVVIGDEHPFIPKAIGENYILVHSSLPPEKRAQVIADALQDFNRHPEKAVAMAKAAQAYFISNFFLCDQLVHMYEAVNRYNVRLEVQLQTITSPIVDLVIQPIANNGQSTLESLARLRSQLKDKARLILIVPKSQKAWYEEKAGADAVIVGVNSSKAILNPFEALLAAGNTIESKKVCFLLGVEEVFGDSLLTACLDLKDQPVGRTAHILKHMDSLNEAHYDGRSGGLDLEALHAIAMASAIFDVAWLRSKVPFSALGWKDICKIAEIESGGIVDYLGTCWTMNLREYEQALAKGACWPCPKVEINELIKTSTQTKSLISGNAVLRRNAPLGVATEFRDLNGKLILGEIKTLPTEAKWELFLDLYKSVPLPAWLRSVITRFRKFIGIR